MALGFKTGGRQKGALNKKTLANREKLQKLFDTEIDNGRLTLALTFLSDKDYANFMLKLFCHLVPKANDNNTAEIEPGEVKAKRRTFVDAPTGEPGEVERQRAADPEEAELAKMIYSGEKPQGKDCFLHFPIATAEEHQRVDREMMDDVAFARLVLWNEKHAERWKRKIEEIEQQAIRDGKYVAGGPAEGGGNQ